MKTGIALVTLLFASLVLAGCNSEPTPESIMEDAAETLEESVKVLKSVQDEASAEAAKAELKTLSEKFRTLNEQEKKFGDLTKEQSEALKKYESRNQAAMTEMLTELARIRADPKLRGALTEFNLEQAP